MKNITVTGTHKGKPVAIEYQDEIFMQLFTRKLNFVEKLEKKGLLKPLAKAQASLDNWNMVMWDSAEIKNYPEIAQAYINLALYNHDKFIAEMQA